MIGTVIEIADAIGTIADKTGKVMDNATKTAVAYQDAKQATMSIAEKAKKSVMMYKVWISSGIREAKLASQINKWLENMYAIFTMMVLGYNPMASNNDEISRIVQGISAESFKPNYNTRTQEAAFAAAMQEIESERNYGKRQPRIGKNAVMSKEADHSITTLPDNDQLQGYSGTIGDIRKDAVNNYKASNRDSKLVDMKFINDVQKNNNTAYPTVVNMKINTGSGIVSIPLAIKCNLYPIGTEEMRLLIESGISGKMFDYIRRIKWRSGEISTLAWIFNTDISKRSKTLYEKLGRNPLFQELQQRKAASKTSFWSKFLTRFGSEYESGDKATAYKQINANIANVPPTSSMIVSTDDLVAASRLNIEHFTKNEGFINRFMKDNFLLCLGIVDLVAEECSFFIMGYKNPFKVSFADLESKSDDQNDSMLKIINELSRKV